MESKESQHRRFKRPKEDNMWDCTVCTYRNPPEAFKCLMCDVRKGTSTRKPRLNAELVAAQAAQVAPPKPKKTERKDVDEKTQRVMPRHTNVDRSTAEHNAVTVNNVTVIITEYQPLKPPTAGNGDATNNLSSSDAGSLSDASTDNKNEENTNERKNS